MAGNYVMYSEPSVARPTVQQLRAISEKLHLHIETDELEHYRDLITADLGAFDRVDKMPENLPQSNYPTKPGYQPTAEQNPYNAWARITDLEGSKTGKLAGKTVAIKDNVHIAGVPLVIGSNFTRGLVSSYTATVVSRILDEGGFIKGKTTCENLCFSGNSFTSDIGPVKNPFDKRRSAGGSSSGSAVAVAVGDVDLAVGTDQGGSIRLPSSWCGIVGLKPTYGLVPYTGIVPLSAVIDHCGPMARTVQDCALLLEASVNTYPKFVIGRTMGAYMVMAGYDHLDTRQPATLQPINYSEQLNVDVAGLRIGLLQEGFEGCETEVENVVKEAAMSLKQLGVLVEEFSSPLHKQARDATHLLLCHGNYATYLDGGIAQLTCTRGFKDTATHDFFFNAARANADLLSTSYKYFILQAAFIQENHGCHFYAKASNVMRDIVAGYDELFKKYDVIVMPTIKYTPPLLPESTLTVSDYAKQAFGNIANTLPYNGTGHPALSINAGFSNAEPRLPIGMMFVGQHFNEVTVLRLASAYEHLRDQSSDDYTSTVAKLTAAFEPLKV